MTSMPMAGQPGRSGRRSNEQDAKTQRELKQALADKPPRKFVNAGKKTVRGAVRSKKKGR